MKIKRIALSAMQRFEARIEERPPWLRWLEAAPFAVREADRSARRALFFYQFPCAAVFPLLIVVAKHFGLLASSPIAAMCLSSAGMVVLLWPAYFVRLALAARRSIADSTAALASRLRTLAIVCFALAALYAVAIACLVGFVIFVLTATSAQSLTVTPNSFIEGTASSGLRPPPAAPHVKR